LLAALLRVARVTAGLAESNGSLPLGLWLMSPVRKENVLAVQRAEMRMVRWMCGVKLIERLPIRS